jgi:hypothetical protein
MQLADDITSEDLKVFLEEAEEQLQLLDEVTFVRLRYSLGGDRPSQTAHQTLFS